MATSFSSNGDTGKWKGVFPAVPTPFNDDGSINEPAYRAILEDNISHGVHGFWNAPGITGCSARYLTTNVVTDGMNRRITHAA